MPSLWCCQYNMTIIIDQHRFPALQKILFRFYIKSVKTAVLKHFFFCYCWRHINLWFGFDDLCGWMYMIQQ